MNNPSCSVFQVAVVVFMALWAGCGGNMRPTDCLEEALVGGPDTKLRECYGAPDWRSICDPGAPALCLHPQEERWHYDAEYSTTPFTCVIVNDGVVTTFLHDSWLCAITEASKIGATRADMP